MSTNFHKYMSPNFLVSVNAVGIHFSKNLLTAVGDPSFPLFTI